MKIPSFSTLLSFTSAASALNQRGSHSANAAIIPQDIHSFLQANSNNASDTNLVRQKEVSDYITLQNNDDGSPIVSTNADLCLYSSTYQCVGSTVTYGTNSSADLTAYVFSENSGVNIFQDDIDRFAMEFAQAAIANADNDVNSTSATLWAYSERGELVASVAVNDPDMQWVQLKAVRALLKNMAAPDGRVTTIAGDTIIDDDSYSQDDYYNNTDDGYSQSYPITSSPYMTYLAAAAGALMVESIAVCVLASCLYYSCRRENAGAVARDESAVGLLERGTSSTQIEVSALTSSETAHTIHESETAHTAQTIYDPEEMPLGSPESTVNNEDAVSVKSDNHQPGSCLIS